VLSLIGSIDGGAAPAVVGFVMRSSGTTISGAPSHVGQTVLGGDTLEVTNGAAEIAIGESKIILGKDTQMSFEPEQSGWAAVLNHGNVTFSRPSDGPALRVRVGEVWVRATPGSGAEGIITVTNQALVVAAKEGTLQVDHNGEAVSVPQGTTLKFLPEQSPGTPLPTAAPSGVRWGRLFRCAGAGAALGSVPVIVRETTSSAAGSWDWGWIPVGAVSGQLVCEEIPPPKQVGIACTLNALRQQDWGAAPQLSYTSTNATALALVPAAAGGGAPQPPGGMVTVAQNGTYTMTATGPGGVATCKARVDWPAPSCNLAANPKAIDAGAPVTLDWSALNSVAPVQLSWSNSGANGADPVASSGSKVVNPTQGTNYTLTVKGPGGTRKCSVFVSVRPGPPPQPQPNCDLELASLLRAFRTNWSLQNVNNVASVLGVANIPGTATTLLGLMGKAPPVAQLAPAGATGAVSGATPVLPKMVQTSLSGAIATAGLNKILPASFDGACHKLALCAVKNGIGSGTINFCNALGRQVARCSWTPQGSSTQWWGWRYLVFDTWGGPPGCDFQLGQ
jgi:hypothetical protein